MVLVVNKLVVVMIVSFLFTVIWSVTNWINLENNHCDYTFCIKGMWEAGLRMWISITILGSLLFLGLSGFYIRNLIKGRRETQNQALEFDTSAIELATVNSGVHDIIDPIQNKLAEEDLDKEIALFEKRKKLVQLKNEVVNLEAVSTRASTSGGLGQVISVNRGY